MFRPSYLSDTLFVDECLKVQLSQSSENCYQSQAIQFSDFIWNDVFGNSCRYDLAMYSGAHFLKLLKAGLQTELCEERAGQVINVLLVNY